MRRPRRRGGRGCFRRGRECAAAGAVAGSILSLWLGLLKIAEEAGLMQLAARLLARPLRLLFPGLPPGHPAFGPLSLNVAANLLGLGNAATPFGIKTMELLQQANPQPQRASAPMLTFLLLNTAGVTLLPTLVIGLRAAAGAAAPFDIAPAAFCASLCGCMAALLVDALLRRITELRR
ncbi:MAG: spore maturation protein [Firmicutes bacterium]|nr:spore maturation protein [Bacillota bacterium]